MLPVVFSANSQAGDYRIANSLRFRSSASAYFNRTPASASSRTTFTWSGWVKKAKIATNQYVFGAEVGGSGSFLFFTSSDTLQFYDYAGGSYQFQLITTQVFRDPSAWYHIVLVSDTTQATAANRIRMYVNGTQITAFGTATYPSQNYANSSIDNNNVQYIGYTASTFDGYLADINFIDGQALTPSSFGEIDSTTGVWKAKRYTGTYGTNGFRLNFSNGTSTTTLGYDSSGNGNNWTTNNISLTAGSTYDWMIDSPTKYPGSSYGVGNYCVLNPLATTGMTGITLGGTTSDGNLGWSSSTSATGRSASFYSNPTDNKWYCETYVSALASGTTTLTWGLVANGGANYRYRVPTDTSATAGDILMTAYDPASGKIWYGKNGTWLASGDPAAGTNPAYTLTGSELNGAVFAVAVGTLSSGTTTVATNFGQRPFAYTPPSGFKTLCTQNLPGVTIQNGAAYMAATTYTGTNASMSVSNAVNGVSFQPDFVWVKARSFAYSHRLQNSIVGTTYALDSSSAVAEFSDAGGNITAFNSNGFSVGTYVSVNNSGTTYVGWQWKAGGTAVTNTAGSITSSVSANTTSGFAVVTYTGTGSNATVGHGLGVAPSMIIVKWRSGGGLTTQDWDVYHASVGATARLFLNTTAASQTTAVAWNNTAPTSSVFSIGTGTDVNGSAATYVAYCFAAIPGYSAFGSYTGNGSSDGPFVYCGFRPRWILIKNAGATGDWTIMDTSRDTYNAMITALYPNLSVSEGGGNVDALSNGFKVRNTTYQNGSGNTMIYAAFAESPFSLSLAR